MILHLDEQQTATYTGNNTSIGFVKNNKYNVIVTQEKTGIYTVETIGNITTKSDCNKVCQYGSEVMVLKNWRF